VKVPVRTTVGKWGNSLGIRIPSALAEELQLREGMEGEVVVAGGRLLAEPIVSLSALIAGITPENLPELAFEDGEHGVEGR
jgi:antitoxin MazE